MYKRKFGEIGEKKKNRSFWLSYVNVLERAHVTEENRYSCSCSTYGNVIRIHNVCTTRIC